MVLGPDAHLKVAADSGLAIPLSTIASLDRHGVEDWKQLGFSLVIDAFTAQALAVTAAREAYTRFLETGATGTKIEGMALHRELVELCGLEPFLDIERATTER